MRFPTQKQTATLERWKDDATGYECLLMQGPFALCGYVRIPEGHPLHGISYNEEIPAALEYRGKEIMDEPVGKRGPIDVLCMAGRGARSGDLFDVHGSVTFSGEREGEEEAEAHVPPRTATSGPDIASSPPRSGS